MCCTNLSPEVKALAKKLRAEYKIPVDLEVASLTGTSYQGPRKTSGEKIDSFIKMLDKMEPGKTYLFVDHPGLDDPELRAIHHIGYEDVASDRQGVTDLFTSAKVKDAIKAKRIQLISYKDLVKATK